MRGFTLIEVITTIAIFIVIMIAVSTFQYNVLSYNRIGTVALTNAQEVESLLKIMAKEIRSMESGSDGSYAISAAATTSLTFFADVDSDGNKEKVRYYIATTTIYRGSIKPTGSPATYIQSNETTKILVTGIRNSPSTPIFDYFDSMYAGTSTPMTYPLNLTSIRLVKVTLTIDTDPNKAPILRAYTTQIGLRNLKDNL
jgi:prepilin-type N-terminal cleavage/methylation domain-containing protein